MRNLAPSGPEQPSSRYGTFALAIGTLAGCVALLVGAAEFGLVSQLRIEQVAKLGFVLLVLLAGGWVIARWTGQPFALALFASFLLATLIVIGPAPIFGALLLLTLAASVSLLLFGADSALPLPVRLLAALCIIAFVIGWTLPLPVHFRFVYVLVSLALIMPQRNQLMALTRRAVSDLQGAMRRRPGYANLAALALVATAVNAWPPSLSYDDLGYHLILPHQLQQFGYYRMDAASQVWAFAPWLGDCLFGFAQVVAGEHARGAVNLLWLAAGAALLFQLTKLLWPTDDRPGWVAVALYFSLPINATLMLGMQTELFSTALLLAALVTVLARDEAVAIRQRYLGAVLLAGGLMLSKTIMLPFALMILFWFGWRHRRDLTTRAQVAMLPLALLGGASAYCYAYFFTGNPVLPLANSVFQSGYFPTSNFSNPIYNAPLDLSSLWAMLFESSRFYESRDGVSGFHWLPLLCAALLACLRVPALRPLVLIGLTATAAIFSAQSYLRYLLPALALTMPAFAVGACLLSARVGIPLLVALVVANLLFQTNASWILGLSAVFKEFTSIGHEEFRDRIAPERRLLEAALAAGPQVRVLVAARNRPFTATAAGRAFTTSWYDTELSQAYAQPRSGMLEDLLRRYAFTHVLTHGEHISEHEQNDLTRLGAQPLLRVGKGTLWSLPDLGDNRIDLFIRRDRSLLAGLRDWNEHPQP